MPLPFCCDDGVEVLQRWNARDVNVTALEEPLLTIRDGPGALLLSDATSDRNPLVGRITRKDNLATIGAVRSKCSSQLLLPV